MILHLHVHLNQNKRCHAFPIFATVHQSLTSHTTLLKQLGLSQQLHDIMAQAYDIILELTDTFEAIQSLTVALVARNFRRLPQSQSVWERFFETFFTWQKQIHFGLGTTLRLR